MPHRAPLLPLYEAAEPSHSFKSLQKHQSEGRRFYFVFFKLFIYYFDLHCHSFFLILYICLSFSSLHLKQSERRGKEIIQSHLTTSPRFTSFCFILFFFPPTNTPSSLVRLLYFDFSHIYMRELINLLF